MNEMEKTIQEMSENYFSMFKLIEEIIDEKVAEKVEEKFAELLKSK